MNIKRKNNFKFIKKYMVEKKNAIKESVQRLNITNNFYYNINILYNIMKHYIIYII